MDTVIAAAIAAVPPTLMAALSWRNARAAKHQTNGALHGPIEEIRDRVERTENLMIRHLEDHAR